ncbi:MAG: SAP domain-containing protein [Treponema sp.]|nr:SAP domain-containing protein [Treponema sp.]
MENRPQFKEIKSYEEFSKYYWYRKELQQICRQLGIESRGMKLELNHNIEEYFKGNLIQKKQRKPVYSNGKKTDTKLLTLETSLIDCRFCFSQRFREFFSAQTGIKNFKFNADMVATAKKVKEDCDKTFTLGDMLEVAYGRKAYAKYDKSCLQWNKFVKDFCADSATARFSNKLKVAAYLWKKVRESTGKKIYSHSLLEEFADKI